MIILKSAIMTLYHGLNLKIYLTKILLCSLFSYSKRPLYIILLNYAAQKWSTKIEHMIKGWNDQRLNHAVRMTYI